MLILNWILIALSGLWVHYTLFTWKYKDGFDIFALCLLYFFASPVIHIAIWFFEDKPNWNFHSIVSLLIYISLCINFILNSIL